jgi:hypothetical protein
MGELRVLGNYNVSRSEVNGVEFVVSEGEYHEEEFDYEEGEILEWHGRNFAIQNIWKVDTAFILCPEICNGTDKIMDLTGWTERTSDALRPRREYC